MADQKVTQKALKVIILLICSCILVFQISCCIQRHLQNDAKVRLSLKSAKQVPVFSMTICPSYQKAYKDEIFTHAQSMGAYITVINDILPFLFVIR